MASSERYGWNASQPGRSRHQRRMISLLVTLTTVFAITFLGTPSMGAGWFWDAGNGVGFASFAGLLYLAQSGNRRLNVRAHQILAYAVLTLVLAHAFWFLLGDAAAVEFIKIGAPDYMWLGIASLVTLIVLIFVADMPDRLRIHRSYASFKYWHSLLTVVAIAGAAYHIIVSNFYLGTWYQAGLFLLVSLAACFGHDDRPGSSRMPIASPGKYLAISGISALAFAGLRNIPA